ncbi:MAG: SpoIIE family protein phosphatase, partial [Desulfobacterales bacterium]|nr:SpoIIE family protein phosphatase [Desulfobacterales bacterium]
MLTSGEYFLEVAYSQHCKHGQAVHGDVFLSHRIKEENRVISVLSDGLGSGVKANVLATLTAAMATKYIENHNDVKQTAEVILDTLPVCSVRKISYSTFTIVDIDASAHIRIVEHGNPAYVVLRRGRAVEIPKQVINLEHWQDRTVLLSEFSAQVGDYILVFSDGVDQAAMGSRAMPLGWGGEAVRRYATDLVAKQPAASANDLARAVADKACELDGRVPKDDITATAFYLRQPRRLLLVTGPPFHMEKDKELAGLIRDFPGCKVICGGTTAKIVSRELHRKIVMSTDLMDPDVPPTSRMQGVDLITEGTITLSRVADVLEKGLRCDSSQPNGAETLAAALLDSDLIQFVVGTR